VKKLKNFPVVFATISLTVALDQLTKIWAVLKLRGEIPWVFLGDLFRIQYAENTGAFLSLGASLPDSVRFWIYQVAVGAVLLGTLYFVLFKAKDKVEVFALALILGGGIGNLIDRVFRDRGAVVDFMNMGIGSLRTGVFNVADLAISTGVVVIVIFGGLASRQSVGSSQKV
jgi:signal peptidase II